MCNMLVMLINTRWPIVTSCIGCSLKFYHFYYFNPYFSGTYFSLTVSWIFKAMFGSALDNHHQLTVYKFGFYYLTITVGSLFMFMDS